MSFPDSAEFLREFPFTPKVLKHSHKRPVFGWAIAVIALGSLLALIIPATRNAREAARRAQCNCNFCMLTLALHNYHATWESFPPAHIDDANGKPMHSWRVLILPYMEQSELYKLYRFDEPWDGPNNRKLIDKMPNVLRCPSRPSRGSDLPRFTNYVALTGPGTAFPDGKTIPFADITDGTVATIMLAEIANANILWSEPRDLDVRTMSFQVNGRGQPSVSSAHPGGAHVAFVDGRRQFLSDRTTPEQLRALTTIDGGEPVDRDALPKAD